MGGNTISIQRRSNKSACKKWRETSTSAWHGRAANLGNRRRKQIATAFHLPEVCRQIYAETAILGYATNTFVLHYCLSNHRINHRNDLLWHLKRNTAQISAITSIRPRWTDIWDSTVDSRACSYKDTFPSLEEVHIGVELRDFDFGSLWVGHHLYHLSSSVAYLEAQIENKVKEVNGQEMRVVFWGESG